MDILYRELGPDLFEVELASDAVYDFVSFGGLFPVARVITADSALLAHIVDGAENDGFTIGLDLRGEIAA